MAVRRAATIPDVAEDETSTVPPTRLAAAFTTGLPVRTHKTDGSGPDRPVDRRWRIGGYRSRVVLTDVLIVVATIMIIDMLSEKFRHSAIGKASFAH